MKLNKKDLCELLNIKINNLKKIERTNSLQDRLKNKGYKLIKKTKEGRNVYYEIEEDNTDKKLLNDICTNLFNTREEEKFCNFVAYRVFNIDHPVSKKDIANKCSVNEHTIGIWDISLLKNNIISKDGFFYIAVDYIEVDGKTRETFRLTSRDEYNTFVRNSKATKQFDEATDRFLKGELNRREYEYIVRGISKYSILTEKKFIYKINKYRLIEESSPFREEFIKLIELIYGIDFESYRINFNEFRCIE